MKNTQQICPQTDSPENSNRTEMTQLVRCETCLNHFKAASVGSLELLYSHTTQEFGKTPSMFHNEGLDTPPTPPTTGDVPLTQAGLYLVGCRGSCLWVVSARFLLLDLDPRHRGRIQGIQEACRLHCCSKTIRQLEIQQLLLLERMLGMNLRCAGMILTLISLAEFDGVFKGLYFFSKGVFSNGPELMKRNKQA